MSGYQHQHPPYNPRLPWWCWTCPTCTPRLHAALSRLDGDRSPRRVECPFCGQSVGYRAGRASKHEQGGEVCRGSLLSIGASTALFRCIRDGRHPATITMRETGAGTTRSEACARVLRPLEAARRTKGVSCQEVSRMLGKRKAAVSSWETGTQVPPLEVLVQWASVLGMRVVLRLVHEGREWGVPLADGRDGVEHLLLQRRRLKLSQGRVCELAGFGNSSLSRWESNYVPHLGVFLVWAAALGGKIVIVPKGKNGHL